MGLFLRFLSQIQSIGEMRATLPTSKIKSNVAHAGHSAQLDPWRELSLREMESSFPLANKIWSIVIQLAVVAMEASWTLPLVMLCPMESTLKRITHMKEGTEAADLTIATEY